MRSLNLCRDFGIGAVSVFVISSSLIFLALVAKACAYTHTIMYRRSAHALPYLRHNFSEPPTIWKWNHFWGAFPIILSTVLLWTLRRRPTRKERQIHFWSLQTGRAPVHQRPFIYIVIERGGGREGGREGERERERERAREREREREREKERKKERKKARKREREKERKRERDKERKRERERSRVVERSGNVHIYHLEITKKERERVVENVPGYRNRSVFHCAPGGRRARASHNTEARPQRAPVHQCLCIYIIIYIYIQLCNYIYNII